MPASTIRLHRVLRAKPEKLYRAFLTPEVFARWLPPYGFIGSVQEMSPKVGGTYRMSFTNFSSGNSNSFGGEYVELIPDEKIVYTGRFDNPNLPGEMRTTVTLRAVSCGTDLQIMQEGVPEVIPPEMCYLGWQESLEQLAKIVEPQIPD